VSLIIKLIIRIICLSKLFIRVESEKNLPHRIKIQC